MRIEHLLKIIEKDPNFYPWSTEKDCVEFIATLIIITQSKIILELGTFLGYTSIYLLKSIPSDGIVFTVDILDQFYSKYFKLLSKKDKNRLTFIHDTTVNALKYKLNKITFDAIFIDADHEFKSCFSDFTYSLCHVKKGTILILHDALNEATPGVKQTINILKGINFIFKNSLFEIISFSTTPRKFNVPASGICIIKILSETTWLYFRLALLLFQIINLCIPNSPSVNIQSILEKHVSQFIKGKNIF